MISNYPLSCIRLAWNYNYIIGRIRWDLVYHIDFLECQNWRQQRWSILYKNKIHSWITFFFLLPFFQKIPKNTLKTKKTPLAWYCNISRELLVNGDLQNLTSITWCVVKGCLRSEGNCDEPARFGPLDSSHFIFLKIKRRYRRSYRSIYDSHKSLRIVYVSLVLLRFLVFQMTKQKW